MINIHRSTYALRSLGGVQIITVEPGTEIGGNTVDDTNYLIHPSGSTIWMTQKNLDRLKEHLPGGTTVAEFPQTDSPLPKS